MGQLMLPRNPALAAREVLIGCGVDPSVIDESAVFAAARYCHERVMADRINTNNPWAVLDQLHELLEAMAHREAVRGDLAKFAAADRRLRRAFYDLQGEPAPKDAQG